MKNLSFIDKLKVLGDVSSSSGLCIATIFIIIFLAVILIVMNKKESKKIKRIMITIYVSLIVILMVIYSGSITSMFDYMMNNLFIIIYFPNLAVYLAAIIASNIIVWKTLFGKKEDKVLKIVNVLFYSIMNYLLILVLNIVSANKLDIFNIVSVYSDNNALALIGLSSTIFIVWIIFLVIYHIIRSRQKEEVEVSIRRVLPSNILEVVKPKMVKESYKYKIPSNINITLAPLVARMETKTKLPSNIVEVAKPKVVKEGYRYKLPANTGFIKAPRVVKDYGIKQIIAPKLARNMNIERVEPIVKKKVNLIDFYSADQKIAKEYDNVLTLEDYKIVLDILRSKNNMDEAKISVEYNNDYETDYDLDIDIDYEDEELDEIDIPNPNQSKLDEMLNLNNA